jgi:predicted neutral ceramidase superfamily lipid hydrolase
MGGNKLGMSRSLVTVCIYFLFALWGLRRAFFADLQPADFIISLVLSAAMVKYCVLDSRWRGKPLMHSYHWIIFFTWPISVPIYLYRTRGIAGIGLVILHTLCLIFVFYAAFALTVYLAHS